MLDGADIEPRRHILYVDPRRVFETNFRRGETAGRARDVEPRCACREACPADLDPVMKQSQVRVHLDRERRPPARLHPAISHLGITHHVGHCRIETE